MTGELVIYVHISTHACINWLAELMADLGKDDREACFRASQNAIGGENGFELLSSDVRHNSVCMYVCLFVEVIFI